MPDGMHLMIPAEEYAEMEARIERLEKALDKSCGLLANKEHYDFVNEKWIERTKEQWKEWLLKND